MPATLESNLRATLDAIEAAARRAGRPGSVELLAVTKSVGPRTAAELVRLGQRDLGENRLASLDAKREELARAGLEATWHFIGPIQRNKARKVVQSSEVLHAVDSLRLVDTLERVAAEEGRRVRVYLEVKLSPEESKHGLEPAELREAVRRAGAAEPLTLLGLMTMAPLPPEGDEGRAAREVFERLAELARGLEAEPEHAACFEGGRVRLSMGMSGDFEAAIAAGSDVVRIGGALFQGVATDAPHSGVAP